MLKRLPKSIWFVTLLIAVVLGILLGIALPQNTMTTAIPLLFGWLFPSLFLSVPGIDYVTHTPLWLIWLTRLYYLLAMLAASACAYGVLWSTGRRLQALLVVGLLACVSTLVCIPVSMIAPSLNRNGTFFTLSLILPVWLNLLFSAGPGWGIAYLIPKSKPRTAS